MSLTAPAHVQAKLIDLQALDTKLVQLARAVENIPVKAELKAISAEVDAAQRESIGLSGVVEDHRTELSRVEADVAVVEARIARDETLLEKSASAKDTQGIDAELSSLRRRRSELEDIELVVMQQLEDAEKVLQAAKDRTTELGLRSIELTGRLTAEVARLGKEKSEVTAQREELAASLPEDLLALYERQRERYGFGASLLQRRVSSASGVELTGNDLEAVRAAAPDAVILCPESQAILVRTAESGL